MSEQIQPYVYDTISMSYVRPDQVGEHRVIVVTLDDHKRLIRRAHEEATTAERKRCRRDEVEPLHEVVSEITHQWPILRDPDCPDCSSMIDPVEKTHSNMCITRLATIRLAAVEAKMKENRDE